MLPEDPRAPASALIAVQRIPNAFRTSGGAASVVGARLRKHSQQLPAVTGPWCLLVAIALLAYEFLDIRPARITFGDIVNAGFIIFLLLWFVPELILGRYFTRPSRES
jgi:hypothetical protein